MENTDVLNDRNIALAWADLQAHANNGQPLESDAYRLAFADPEFLLRRETRGIRFQLEMLKPDLAQQAQGIENTVVVFGSARFPAPEDAQLALTAAQLSGNAEALKVAQRRMRNAHYYDQARLFARLVANYSADRAAADRLYICTAVAPALWKRPTAVHMKWAP